MVYGHIEYFIKLDTDAPELYIPLMIRVTAACLLILLSIIVFEILSSHWFRQRRFVTVLVFRSLTYTLIITFWLYIVNIAWFLIESEESLAFELGVYTASMYLINIVTVFILSVIFSGISQINTLHRRGELWSFIIGHYHRPREVDRIFCFIDLKGSTTIAEKLGHERYASFLKDYYSDITDALRHSIAQVYQYVGDEVVLSWSFQDGLKNGNAVHCFFEMRAIIDQLQPKYQEKYGVVPAFRAGLHGGKVIVTWVGELKKEVVYIGDVLNTAARLQESCKTYGKDFLISEKLLDEFGEIEHVRSQFVDSMVPRGREESINVYSLETDSRLSVPVS